MTHSTLRSPVTWLLALIVIQPVLDVLSYWLNASGSENTLTLALRLLLLLITCGTGFLMAPHKRPYYITGSILLLLVLGHIAACLQYGYGQPLRDLTNLVRIFLLPLTTLSFITFLQVWPELRAKIPGAFFLCLVMILLVELLSTVTGTDPHTYANKSIGVLGWFYFANSQSAILTMLVPVSIVYAWHRWPGAIAAGLCSLIGMGMLFLFATRLAYLGCLAVGAALGLCFLLHRNKALGLWLLVLTLVFGAMLPISPMAKNQKLVAENAILKQEDIDTMTMADTAAAEAHGLTGDQLRLAQLEHSYETYLPGLVEHFGLQRTAEAYSYSTRASDICDVRRARITYSRLLLEDSPTLSKFFGMELSRWDSSSGSYDVENDMHGIFFLCGGAGLCLILIFFGYFIVAVLCCLFRYRAKLLTPDFVALCTALILCGAHVYATAGVLRRPNAAFYLAVCLAMLWQDTKTPHMKET